MRQGRLQHLPAVGAATWHNQMPRLLLPLLLLPCLLRAVHAQTPPLAQRRLQADAPNPFDQLAAPTPNPPPAGVNLPDILWRSVDGSGNAAPAGLASALATIADACSPPLFLARFPILPMWPSALRAILANTTQYFGVLDALLAGLSAAGCTFQVPVVFYNPYALVDAYGESMAQLVLGARNASALGGVSLSFDASMAFIDALVARYSAHQNIRAWELSHEWNLQYDMDASAGCYACNASRGTPPARSRAYSLSTADGGLVQQRWAARLRAGDAQLRRPVSSGHALPRPAAFHLNASFARSGGAAEGLDWTPDSHAQFTAMLAATHVGMDWVSVHVRPGAGMARAWAGLLPPPPGASGALQLLVGLTQSLDNITGVSTGGTSQQRLFLGEFGGAQGNYSNATAPAPAASGAAAFASGIPFVDELLAALVATGLNAASPPPGAVTGLFVGAAAADFGFSDAARGGAPGALDGVYAAAAWPGQQDGLYGDLVAAKARNASGSESLWPGLASSAAALAALARYGALHTAPAFVVPGACDLALFRPPYDYYHTARQALAQRCFAAIRALAMGEFSPPSRFDVATAMCKGACRAYAAAWFRLQGAWAAAGCACTPLNWSQFGGSSAPLDGALAGLTNNGFLCPHSPNAELCRRTGLCYEDVSFYNWTCSAGACGRFAASSAEYNAARAACNLPTDGSGSAAVAAAALAALAAAALALAARE